MVLPFKNEHYFEGEGGGAINLNDLLDVNVTNPQNTQALTFDASNGVFKNEYLVDWTVDQVDVNIHADNIPILNYAPNTLASNGQKGLTEYNFSLARKNKLDGIANGAEVNVQSDFNVTDTNSDAFILNKPTIQDGEFSQNNFTNTLKNKLNNIADGAEVNVQSDFNVTDTNSDAFILNKPTIQDGQFSQNNFTNTLKNKLNNIADGAEVNVQSDFNVTDTNSDAFILNKPTIQDGQFSQNNFTDALKNKLDGIEDSADANYDLSAIATNELLSKDSATTVKGSSLQTIESSSPTGILLNFSKYNNPITTSIGGIYNYIENITSNYVKRLLSKWGVTTTDATSGLWLIVKSISTKTFVGINTGASISQDFQVGSTFYVDDTNNRVGIGISSPEENLEIDGSIQIDSANIGRLKFQKSGATPHAEGEIDAETDGTNGGQIDFLTKVDGGSVTEKLRINNIGAIGIGGANYGNSGQVIVSNGSGSAVSWANQTDTTYTNGTGVNLVGTTFSIGQPVGTSDSPSFNQITTGSAGTNQGIINFKDLTNLGTDTIAQIKGFKSGSNGGELQLFTKVDGGNLTEKVSISSNGTTHIQTDAVGLQVTSADGVTQQGYLYNSTILTDKDLTLASYSGTNTSKGIVFRTQGTDKFKITSTGALGVGSSFLTGNSGQVLTSQGSSASPIWTTPSSTSPSNLYTLVPNTTNASTITSEIANDFTISNTWWYEYQTNTYRNGAAHGQGQHAFYGGVLAPNGKVILVPTNSSVVGIYDPNTNVYSNGASHGGGSNTNAFYGGVLAPNGNIIFVPRYATTVGIYYPNTNVYTNGASHGEGTDAFFGGVLAPNGKVIFVPSVAQYVGIYDPIANTYTRGAAISNHVNYGFQGGVLAPNGKVILVPRNSSTVGIYDPIANTFTSGATHGEGSNAFIGGVLAPNGKIILVPAVSQYVGIYDPIANTYTRGAAVSNPVSYAFHSGVLAPDGKIIFAPHYSTTIGIYDPINNTFTNGATHGRGIGAFSTATLAQNGKIILIPAVSTFIGIFGINTKPLLNDTFERNPLLPYFNKF